VSADIDVQPAFPPARNSRRRGSTTLRVLKNPIGLACSIVLFVIVVVGIFAGQLAPHDPNYTSIGETNASPFGSSFVLGGDGAGRDVLSQLIWGTRDTLLGSVVLLAVALIVGVVAGLIAGYRGGAFETASGWLSDGIMALPGVVLLIALYSVIGSSIILTMAVYGILVAPIFYRLVRGVVRSVRKELYVDAARVAGLSDLRIVFRHLLTAVRGPIIITSAFILGGGIAIQATLQFIGLGSPTEASWGEMLQLAFTNLYQDPLNVFWPGAAIVLTILALALLGNVLRDTLQSNSNQVSLSKRGTGSLKRELAAQKTPSAAPVDTTALLDLRGLNVYYPQGSGVKQVVSDLDFTIARGEIHGLVGESGSGKSQTVFSILGLLPKEAISFSQSMSLAGNDLSGDPNRITTLRGRVIAYVPQEPMSNLDPSFRIGEQLTYGLRAARGVSRREAKKVLLGLLERMGIRDPESVWNMYPHEISGGMAQRVLITGAVAAEPDLIVADEPTTALDVTVQADVLQLLRELRDERGLGMIFVTHDLGVVADICDTVSVMRAGEIVESNDVLSLFSNPQHPYTKELLSASLGRK
jgi:ABC-type dipeptide/oligopeptide/nickel transport system ATPase component/ABC-type dipeptide/oligopeptide/nickel transport system permease subunit